MKTFLTNFLVLIFLVSVSGTATGKTRHRRLPSSLPKKHSRIFVSGFKKVAGNCRLHARPSRHSKAVIRLRRRKRLWVESFDTKWSIAYRRSGQLVFVPNSCLM